MEVKINREIRNYTESMLFRAEYAAVHLFCSRLRRGRGPLFYPAAPTLGWKTLSWMCNFWGRTPLCHAGVHHLPRYDGGTNLSGRGCAREMLEPKEFKFEDSNYYYAALKDTIEELQTGRPGKKRRKEPKHFSKRKEAKHD